MVEEKQSFGSLIHRKSFLLLSFLIFNSIAWLFLIMHIIDFTGPRSISQFSWIFYLAAIVSLLIGPLISEKTNKIRLLFIWVILGIISSISYAALPLFGEYGAKALLIFWGFSFGIGFPSCLSLIPSLTKIGERGRAGGITLFTTYAILPVLFILISDLDIFPASLALAGWRSLSLGALLLQVDIDKTSHLKPASYCSILRNSTFLLYLLPWLAFCLVNYLEIPVFEQFFGEFTTELMISSELIIGCFSCIIGGWLIDQKGRRWGIILVLMAIGIGFAMLSISYNIPLALVIHVIIDGAAFGTLTVAFIFVVWGDIANGEQGEKFYAMGITPVPLAIVLSAFFSPWLMKLGEAGAFYFASFFLFLAVIPIFFAPELLPERIIKERELRKYLEEAKKVAGRG